MARLTAAVRRELSASKFALSGRRFPVEDRSHADAALRDVTRSLRARDITPAQAATVRRKADAALGKKGSGKSR